MLAEFSQIVPVAAVVSGYIPIHDEINPARLMDKLSMASTLALPRLGASGMEFLSYEPGDELVEGPFGLREPPAGTPVVPDLVLVPLLGFTRRGDRLGYGGGHYDRWLAAHPQALAVGLAFAAQEFPTLPTEPHDRRLDGVLTERELIALTEWTDRRYAQ